MADEETIVVPDPLLKLEDLKKTTVSKEEYERVLNERNIYFNELANGSPAVDTAPEEKPVDIGQLRKDLFVNSDRLNNVEYANKALELREAILKKDGKDIFVGANSKLVPEQYDIEQGQKVADLLSYCVEASEGDVGVFNAQLSSHLQDVSIPRRK